MGLRWVVLCGSLRRQFGDALDAIAGGGGDSNKVGGDTGSEEQPFLPGQNSGGETIAPSLGIFSVASLS
jgi:hypothetical protein